MFQEMASRNQVTIQAVMLALCILLFGCAPLETHPGSPAIDPVTGSSGQFKIHEFPLVEASSDSPNHIEFQNRAFAAVANQPPAWPFTGSRDITQAPNQALAPFGYRLESNSTPPFSGFTLYHGEQLVQRDIARFWPVSIRETGDGNDRGDFILTFETMNGDRLVAGINGIHPYPDQEQSAVGKQNELVFSNQVASVDNSGSELKMSAAVHPLYGSKSAADVFGWQLVAGEPFYFYMSGDLVRLNYAGKDLAYTYDQVIHNNTGDTGIFNPGSTGRVGWFYALRDGLWYYVEVGVFD